MKIIYAALAIVAVPASAQPASAPAPAIQSDAQRLAALVLPKDKLLAVRLPRFETRYAAELAGDASIAALEKKRPGITRAIAAAGREEAALGYGASIDALRGDAAKLYAARVSAADMAMLIRFYASPVGQMLIGLSAGSAGENHAAFEADRRRRATEALRQLSPAQQRDLLALRASGVIERTQGLLPEVAALSARRFGDADTAIRARLPASRARAVAAFGTLPMGARR